MTAVAVVTGGGELLLLPGGNRRIGRSHGNGDKCGCCDGQAGGTADGARGCLNHRAACGHAGGYARSTESYASTAAADAGYRGGAGGPGGSAGQVLMAAVTIGSGGGELLPLTSGNRRIAGCHRQRHQRHRGNIQADRGLNRARSSPYCRVSSSDRGGHATVAAGYRHGTRRPSHGTRKVLMAAVAVSSDGGELLLLADQKLRLGRSDCQRHQFRAVVDLLDLRSGKGGVVNAEVVNRTGVKLIRAGAREQIEGIVAKVIGVGGGVHAPGRAL